MAGTRKKVFVYGTLKMGGRFAVIYQDLFDPNRVEVKQAKIKGGLFDLGSYPGVKLDEEGEVHGELHIFENPEKILPVLDSIEGYNEHNPEGGLYNRVEVEVEVEDGEPETALVYVFNGTPRPEDKIEAGVWELNG